MRITMLTLAAAALTAGAQVPCDGLAKQAFGEGLTIHAAAPVAAQANLPAHCDVRGVIFPEGRFVVKLPAEWNNRFQMVGNGGTAGVLSLGAVDAALRKGFAAASTDTGHDAAKEEFASFAYVTPQNPHGLRKREDFAYRAVHETAVLAKRIVRAHYGRAARYSYWVGCSTGGRQGMQEAQRYPEDFDGYVIGAPGLFLTGNVMRRVWVGQSQQGEGAVPVENLPALARAVYAKCDTVDGLGDGIIDDPRRCGFSPARDLPRCTTAPGAECFTPAQIASLERIYGGMKNSRGRVLFPGEPVGSESVWAENLVGPSKTVLPRAESQMKFMLLDPPPGPSWSFTQFDFDRDPDRLSKAAADFNPRNPDLSAVKKRGGKIVHYSGWADQQVNPLPGIEYYEAVTKRMGAAATRDFYRLYMVPGMFHCSGGPGCGSVDWLTAVMDWVEQGKAPEALTGAHVEKGVTTKTRPACPYPQVARYKGVGSVEEAGSFSCVAPK